MSDLHARPAVASEAPVLSRRRFFGRFGAAAAATAFVVAGCDTDDPGSMGEAVILDFATDFGVLNYAYALEQLEYAFYEQVVQGAYFQSLADADEERQILQDLRDHELAHVDFFATAIPALGGSLIADLTPDFSTIDFGDRDSVLATAQTFEDLGVSAYNGAGRFITEPDLLTVAGKIVSVEARHAAAIRSIFQTDPRAFAGDDVVDAMGLDVARPPSEVLSSSNAGAFIANTIELRNIA